MVPQNQQQQRKAPVTPEECLEYLAEMAGKVNVEGPLDMAYAIKIELIRCQSVVKAALTEV
jgi:hypothetical protein